MDSHGSVEKADMGKKQKNAFLDEGLCQLVEAFLDVSGSSFSRVVTASLMKFLLEHPVPDSSWLRYASALEKGKINFPLKPGAQSFSIDDVQPTVAERNHEAANNYYILSLRDGGAQDRHTQLDNSRRLTAASVLSRWQEITRDQTLSEGLIASWHDSLYTSREYLKASDELDAEQDKIDNDKSE